MKRVFFFLYGVACHVLFLATSLERDKSGST